MSLKIAVEFLLYGVAAITAMKYLDMTIAKFIGDKSYIYLIMAIVLTATASKIAGWVSTKLGGT